MSEHLGLGLPWFERSVLLSPFFHWVTLGNSLLWISVFFMYKKGVGWGGCWAKTAKRVLGILAISTSLPSGWLQLLPHHGSFCLSKSGIWGWSQQQVGPWGRFCNMIVQLVSDSSWVQDHLRVECQSLPDIILDEFSFFHETKSLSSKALLIVHIHQMLEGPSWEAEDPCWGSSTLLGFLLSWAYTGAPGKKPGYALK